MNSFRMGDVIPLIQAEAQKQGVDPQLAIAHFIAENTNDGVLNPTKEVSLSTQGIGPDGKPSGAVGLFQVTGTTLKGLRDQGYIPPNLNFASLEGQIQSGVAAVKEAFKTAGGKDPLAGAAQYVNGNAGLAGYNGSAPLPAQTAGYLPKIARAMGMTWSGKKLTPETQGALTVSTNNYQDIMARNLPMLRALGIENADATAQASDAVRASVDANAGIIDAAAIRESGQVNSDNNMLGIFGLRNSDLEQSMTKYADLQHQMDDTKPQIDALMSINPLEHPVDWLVAQFKLQSAVPAYNALVQNRDGVVGSIATRQQLDAQQKTLTPAVTLDTIANERQSKLELVAAQAQANLAKLKIDNINASAKFMSEEISWAQGATQISQANARLMAETIGLRQQDGLKKDEQAMLDQINVYRLGLGAPPVPTMQQFKALPRDQQDMLINSAGSVSTPGKTIAAIQAMGTLSNIQRAPGMSAMGDLVTRIAEAAKPAIAQISMADPRAKDGEVIEKAVDMTVKKWREQIKTGDMLQASADNPYKMNATQFAMAKGLEDNQIAKFVLGEGKALPQLGEKEILSYAVGQVGAGRDQKVVAQEIEDFFIKGYKNQFQMRGMGTLGFDPRTYFMKGETAPQVSYAVSENVFGWSDRLFGRSPAPDKPIQLMNKTSIDRFLTMARIKQITQNAPAVNTDFMPGMSNTPATNGTTP